MLALIIVTTVVFCVSYTIFLFAALIVFHGAIIYSYLFVWDDDMRRATCPKGLWRTLIEGLRYI